ncbi:MAG: hypothetical protein ACREQZ_15730 [Woeseiaceae bacterium]
MALGAKLFSSESESLSVPAAFNTGFSETGQATSVNVNLAGKIKVGKRGILQPQVTLTDQGAIAASREFASDIAGDAFSFAAQSHEESTRATLDLGRAAFNFADVTGARAFNFADVTGARQRDTFEDALGLTERVAVGQSGFARDLFGDSLAAVTGVVREGQMQLGNTVSNLNAIARAQATSSDERVQDIARIAIYAAGGLAAVLVLAWASRAAR